MTGKRVQFGEDASGSIGSKTWPSSVLKNRNEPILQPLNAGARWRKQKAKALVTDVYRGYRTLDDVDSFELFSSLVKEPGDNALMSWTVLNMILRTTEMRLQFQQTPELRSDEVSICDVDLSAKNCVALIDRASTHFDVYSQSADVLDSRVLSQIMRTVELLWVRASRDGFTSEISQSIDSFVARCIGLIRTKPSSKSLATIAIRVINLVDWSVISESRIKSLIDALGRTQLAFATSFAAESVIAYTDAARIYPNLMAECQKDWVHVALRALFANSPLTRSQSAALLSGCTSPQAVVDALNDNADTGPQSDALARTIGRRMLAMVQVAGEDDAQLLMRSWSLVLKAVIEVDHQWKHLDLWLDIAKAAFRTNMDAALTQWETLVSVSSASNRYDILLYPFTSGIQLAPAQCAGLIDSAVKMLRIEESLWDSFLEEIFKTLGQSKNEQYPRMVLQRMEAILRPVRSWLGSNISRALSVCMVVFRNPVSCPHLCANVWRLLVDAASTRPQSMELLRFHYKFLSLDLPVASSLTSILMRSWPLKTLTEKAKPNSHSLLSLTLLPITSFGTTAWRVEYIEKNILSHFRTSADVITVLRILLTTVTNNESQQSHQLGRWSTVAQINLNALPKCRDSDSQSLLFDIGSMFVSLFSATASKTEWLLWTRLVVELEAPDLLLSKVGSIGSDDGFRAILNLNLVTPEKVRIIAESLTDNKLAHIKKAAKEGVINSEFVDGVAKILTARSKQHSNVAPLAVALLPPARTFVIAGPLLEAIAETRSATLVTLWNNKVLQNLNKCPAFVTPRQQAKLAREIPALRIPDSVVTVSLKREPETPPQPAAKRPRRRILTGSVPPSLSTPPPSSDIMEDTLPSSADELSSSPPRNAQLPMPSWQSAQERARVLKRVIMGLNMGDAMQGMKRTECEMIYNLLFRACVDLHTHLADTAPTRPDEEVNDAREKLQEVLSLRKQQEEREIEEARLRQIKREESEELEEDGMQDDDELSDFVNDDDDYEDNDDDDCLSRKRTLKGSQVLSISERTLRLKT